ncbi:hypothetical protein EVAR_83246_1 [Eumeta japonica]|uniref:Uncharacterized protein n=1 Tax=Eumeta variegata TaxID=151549 RepID=A0A4C1Y224_EUMVA|nr:hypothetical protein EVAR_83246_1 [Eumeta japonica]
MRSIGSTASRMAQTYCIIETITREATKRLIAIHLKITVRALAQHRGAGFTARAAVSAAAHPRRKLVQFTRRGRPSPALMDGAASDVTIRRS